MDNQRQASYTRFSEDQYGREESSEDQTPKQSNNLLQICIQSQISQDRQISKIDRFLKFARSITTMITPDDLKQLQLSTSLQQIDMYQAERIISQFETSFSRAQTWRRKDKSILIWVLINYLKIHSRRLFKFNLLATQYMTIGDLEEISNILGIKLESTINQINGIFDQNNNGQRKVKWTQVMDERLLSLTGIAGLDESPKAQVSQGRKMSMEETLNLDWNLICVRLNFELETEYFLNKKQIRDHWNNKMNPEISQEKFSAEEDQIILNFISQGCYKWSLISQKLLNRTQHQIKNRFKVLEKNSTPKKGSSRAQSRKKLPASSSEESQEENLALIKKIKSDFSGQSKQSNSISEQSENALQVQSTILPAILGALDVPKEQKKAPSKRQRRNPDETPKKALANNYQPDLKNSRQQKKKTQQKALQKTHELATKLELNLQQITILNRNTYEQIEHLSDVPEHDRSSIFLDFRQQSEMSKRDQDEFLEMISSDFNQLEGNLVQHIVTKQRKLQNPDTTKHHENTTLTKEAIESLILNEAPNKNPPNTQKQQSLMTEEQSNQTQNPQQEQQQTNNNPKRYISYEYFVSDPEFLKAIDEMIKYY